MAEVGAPAGQEPVAVVDDHADGAVPHASNTAVSFRTHGHENRQSLLVIWVLQYPRFRTARALRRS